MKHKKFWKKLTIFSLVMIGFLSSCKQENNLSELEQRKQELENKKLALQDKKAIAALEEELKTVDAEMKTLTENIVSDLQQAIDENRNALLEMILPGISKSPPAQLRSRSLVPLSDTDLEKFISDQLGNVIPDASDLVGKIELNCDFKEMTYEMVNDPKFVELVKEKFRLNIDSIHSEESAAGERNN